MRLNTYQKVAQGVFSILNALEIYTLARGLLAQSKCYASFGCLVHISIGFILADVS